jgi:hypothetical protein
MLNNHNGEKDRIEGRATLMHVTAGITEPNLSAEPLATEAEATTGPNHINPYRSEEERRIVEEIERVEREQQDDELYKTGSPEIETRGPRDSPLLDPPGAFGTDVTADLPGPEFGELEETIEMPEFDPFEYDGPQF